MKATTNTKPTGPALEEPMIDDMDKMLNSFASSMWDSIEWKPLISKVLIGYLYFVLGWFAADSLTAAVMVLTNIVWLQYVIAFVMLCAAIYLLIITAPTVANATYTALDYVGTKVSSLFGGSKDFFFGIKTKVVNGFTVRDDAVVH